MLNNIEQLIQDLNQDEFEELKEIIRLEIAKDDIKFYLYNNDYMDYSEDINMISEIAERLVYDSDANISLNDNIELILNDILNS